MTSRSRARPPPRDRRSGSGDRRASPRCSDNRDHDVDADNRQSGAAAGARDDDADRRRALSMFQLSADTVARLDRFVAVLRTWQRRTNLIAPSTVTGLWTRHVADSLQLVNIVTGRGGCGPVVVDVGSGGGFPGMVIACAVADVTGAEVHLVESNLKKAAFLREAVRETGAPGVVHAARFDEVLPVLAKKPVDYVTARALAPLPELLELIAPLIKAGATAVLPKGRDVADELTESTARWHIEVDTVPSITNAAARIVIVTKLTPRSGNTGSSGAGAGTRDETG